MFDIEMKNASPDFLKCYQAAGRQLQTMGEKTLRLLSPDLLMLPPHWGKSAVVWLKAEPRPPFLEHLSFRLGNQLFFVRIEDIDGKLEIPGTCKGLQYIANACKGYACIMPMIKRGGQWKPAFPNWGIIALPDKKALPRLRNINNGCYGILVIKNTNVASDHPYATVLPVDPAKLVTDERMEMTDWELQDFAVQIVRNSFPCEKIMSWNADPGISPSLWFVGDYGPEWVVVKVVLYPETDADIPPDIKQIAKGCSKRSSRGNFAVVGVRAVGREPLPIYRGHAVECHYTGLRRVTI